MEQIIRKCFRAWIDKDIEVIKRYFADNITYTECYGPVYLGKTQCLIWFEDWNRDNSVLVWDIKRIIENDSTCIVEWYFECNFEGNIAGFDGVSIFEFNEDMLITSVKEFQSKSEHVYPYGE